MYIKRVIANYLDRIQYWNYGFNNRSMFSFP